MPRISQILNEVESQRLNVPKFQRGWVWQKKQVREFFNSLYHDYPVGSLIVWPTASAGRALDSIIDGQQRLTALYGVIHGKAPSWIADEDTSALTGLMFHLDDQRFEHATTRTANDPLWIDVSALFTKGHEAWAAEYRQRTGEDATAHYHIRVARLLGVRDKQINVDKLPEDVSPETAADVFKIVNRAGKSVSEGDLVLGQLSLKWDDAKREVNDALGSWRDGDYAVSLEWLLHTMSAVLEYRINFDALLRANTDDAIRSFSIAKAETMNVLDHVRDILGLDATTSTAINNGLIVVVVDGVVHRSKGALSPNTRSLIGWWLLSTLHGRWSGDVRNRTNRDVGIVAAGGGTGDLLRELRSMIPAQSSLDLSTEGFGLSKTSKPYFLLVRTLTRRRGARDLGSGINLSFDHMSPLSKLEAHHIFPRRYLNQHGLERAQIDQLANLAFITQRANLKIGAKSPAEYLPELEARNPGVLESQWIPRDPDLWTVNAYPRFLEERSRLLANAANELLRSLIGEDL